MMNYLIVCVDTNTPRVDRKTEPMNITKGKIYEVHGEEGFFYRIINDKGKSARYIKNRFTKVDT